MRLVLALTLMLLPQTAPALEVLLCGDADTPAAQAEEAVIAAWNEAHDGEAEITRRPWGHCQTETLARVARGQGPDLAYLSARVVPGLAMQGALAEMPEAAMEGLVPGAQAAVLWDGSPRAIPRAMTTRALLWSPGLISRAGVEMADGPATLDDVLTAARVVSENGAAMGYGLPAASDETTALNLLTWFYAQGGVAEDDEGALTFDTPEMRAALETLAELARYSDRPVAQSRASLEAELAAGRVAMAVGGPWSQSDSIQASAVPGPGPGLMVLDVLAVLEGPNADEAADLARALTAPEAQAAYEEALGLTPLYAVDGSDDPFTQIAQTAHVAPQVANPIGFDDVLISAVQALVLGETDAEGAALRIQEGVEALRAGG